MPRKLTMVMFTRLPARLALTALPLLLAACVPLPMHKTLVPDASITVLDEDGQPLPGTRVELITGAYPRTPDGWERDRTIAVTDSTGKADFAAVHEWKVEVPGMIHGSLQYGWQWCVERPGYRTWRSDAQQKPFAAKTSITMLRTDKPAESGACAAERFY